MTGDVWRDIHQLAFADAGPQPLPRCDPFSINFRLNEGMRSSGRQQLGEERSEGDRISRLGGGGTCPQG